MRTKDWTIANGETFLFVGAKGPKGVSLQIFVRAEVKGLDGFTEFKGREREVILEWYG